MAAPLFDLKPTDKLLELVFDQLKILFPMEEFADKHNGKKANQKFSSNKKKTASTDCQLNMTYRNYPMFSDAIKITLHGATSAVLL